MSDLYIEVVCAYQAGVKIRDIAKNLNIPINWVFDLVDESEESNSNTEHNNIS
jgi:hypothetical protein